jgi:hypothetical protein
MSFTDCLTDVINVWREKIGDESGFGTIQDLGWMTTAVSSRQAVERAIVLRLMIHLPEANEYVNSAARYRDFLMDVFANRPHKTLDKNIYGLVVAAVQMCDFTGDVGNELIENFIDSECRKQMRGV